MRLNELLEDVASPANIKVVADTLDARAYQPADKVKAGAPVLDVEIPTNSSNHFIQRYNERSGKANFNLKDIFKLLYLAKTDPALGYKDELDALSRENYPLTDIVIQDKDKLTIPAIVKPNPQARKMTDGNPVALDRNGNKIPKNQIIPKTVYRKGVED